MAWFACKVVEFTDANPRIVIFAGSQRLRGSTKRQQRPGQKGALAENDVWHAAKLRGVAFRAIGQEPGWLLEIKNGEEILIVTDYGQNRAAYPYVEPREDKAAEKTVFQVDEDVSVLIENIRCTDSMSGESFEVTVTLTTGGQAYKGCGRALF